jgi:hypothetical protein
MLRTLAIATLAVACLAATPGRTEMNSVFGNTVVSRYPEFSDGRRLAARGSVAGEQICLSNMRPNMLIPRFCTRMVEAEVGQTWQSRDPLGRRVQNVLIAGRNP